MIEMQQAIVEGDLEYIKFVCAIYPGAFGEDREDVARTHGRTDIAKFFSRLK